MPAASSCRLNVLQQFGSVSSSLYLSMTIKSGAGIPTLQYNLLCIRQGGDLGYGSSILNIHCAVGCGGWEKSGSVETVTKQLETVVKVGNKNNILMPLISKLKSHSLQIGDHLTENIWLWLAIG